MLIHSFLPILIVYCLSIYPLHLNVCSKQNNKCPKKHTKTWATFSSIFLVWNRWLVCCLAYSVHQISHSSIQSLPTFLSQIMKLFLSRECLVELLLENMWCYQKMAMLSKTPGILDSNKCVWKAQNELQDRVRPNHNRG